MPGADLPDLRRAQRHAEAYLQEPGTGPELICCAAQGMDALGRVGEPFTFEGLANAHGARLSVGTISAKDGSIEPVQQFILTAA